RPGREVEAGLPDRGELAEEQLHRLLLGLDGVERRESPEPDRRKRAETERATGDLGALSAPAAACRPARPAAAPAHQDAQLVGALADDLLDVGNLRPVARAPPAPPARPVLVVVAVRSAPAPRASAASHPIPHFLFKHACSSP